ncbi:MAG: acylphosphatase [Verrucomicrobiales bacterium]
MTAKRIYFEGRVQGVGFRYTTRRVAQGFEVVGWVKNLPDGRVQMEVMSNDPAELDAFIEEIRANSPLAHHIKNVSTESIPPLTGLTGFDIIH